MALARRKNQSRPLPLCPLSLCMKLLAGAWTPNGVVERRVVPTTPATVEYSLTDLGMELVPVIESIVGVSDRLRRRKLPA